ncbi:MAG: methyltransferase domain-containing protein [Bdellovibrionota bacterium]
MLLTTLPRLRCPNCIDGTSGELSLEIKTKRANDVLFGTLTCNECASSYPILAGIAVLVNDVEQYLQFHVKGVSALVDDSEIPELYRESYLQAKSAIETGFTEEDLESQRVNALYFMNHYVSAAKAKKNPWWRPAKEFSPEIDRLVKNFWDNGPFAKIAQWTKSAKNQDAIELACGSGGLAQVLAKTVRSYLGVDSAFAGIALARHINLGAPYSLSIQIPQDLYNGPLTGKVAPPKALKGGKADFVVGEIENLPVAKGHFDLSVVLNAIDMIEDPSEMPRIQYGLLKKNGIAIQSSPYIWHDAVAEQLRKSLPKKIKSSSAAVEYLYENSGFKIFKKLEHVPWMFLKHFRQIEVYSVHLFAARKK